MENATKENPARYRSTVEHLRFDGHREAFRIETNDLEEACTWALDVAATATNLPAMYETARLSGERVQVVLTLPVGSWYERGSRSRFFHLAKTDYLDHLSLMGLTFSNERWQRSWCGGWLVSVEVHPVQEERS